MIVEKEAGKFICPHLPVDTVTEQANDCQVTRVQQFAFCWGSKCAMWRWKLEADYVNAGAHIAGAHLSKTEGYCGLAERPFADR
jgi:hypothetical protein